MWGYQKQRGGCAITYNGQMIAETQTERVAQAVVAAMNFVTAITPNLIVPDAEGIAQAERGKTDALVAHMGFTLGQVELFAHLAGAVDAVRQSAGPVG